MSCSLFFLEPNPFVYPKIDYLIVLCSSVWVIYTIDHILDGKKLKGQTGILRYDQNYIYAKILIPICCLVSAYAIWLVFKNRSNVFVTNGLMLLPILSIYFFLKYRTSLKPLLKMVIVSIIVSTVVVNLYYTNFYQLLKLEWIVMALLVFLNQLILYYFESEASKNNQDNSNQGLYVHLIKRIFIWIVVVLTLTTLLNKVSWPFTLSMFCIAFILRMILIFKNWFMAKERYRFWADFSFVLLWPLLKGFLSIAWILF